MLDALNAFWAHHQCHRIEEGAIYCGFCDGPDAPEGVSWREALHESTCPFEIAKKATGED